MWMKRSAMLASAATVAGLYFYQPAQAAYITFGTATTISGDTDVSTIGTFVRAYTFDAAPNGSVNGVTFTEFNTSGYSSGAASNTGNVGDTVAGFQGGISGFTNSGLSTEYEAMLNGEYYVPGNGSMATGTVTLKNLTAGDEYQIEVWVQYPQMSASTHSVTVSGDAGGGTPVILYDSNQVAAGGLGEYAIGTFTLPGGTTSQTVNFGGANGAVNALELRDLGSVPEPTALGLISVAALGLMHRSRRNADV